MSRVQQFNYRLLTSKNTYCINWQSLISSDIFIAKMAKQATNIQPLFDNVLIRPLDAEEKTASGIILPDSVKEKPQVGTVMAVGKGKVGPKGEVHPMVVTVGQKVMYKKWGGNEVKVNGEEWTLVSQDDILAVVS